MFRPPGGAPFAAPALGMPLWTQVTSPDGRMYYVNMQTGETSWTLPPGGVAVPAILPQPAAPATVFTPAPAVVAETVEEKEKPVSQCVLFLLVYSCSRPIDSQDAHRGNRLQDGAHEQRTEVLFPYSHEALALDCAGGY